ncbi:hypothetical protein DM01DRAFT_1017499 [Hesseltinella vesiculosa]|uniref:RRM domain-containing protein n=1 Tax=Hesseltinella vesiculosa TaxID=101127 RepID=A0A1X2GKY8_9FUNG|nr:hypothetical protein DM01DRAFT_1017499 [Hesseltinella vesiculosa]
MRDVVVLLVACLVPDHLSMDDVKADTVAVLLPEIMLNATNEDVNPGDNLFVTGLSLNTTNTALEDLFSKHGAVQKVEIMYDPHTRESRGFGFIQMHSSDEAERALESVNGMEVDGRVITVEKAKRSKARTPTPGRYYGPPKRPLWQPLQ